MTPIRDVAALQRHLAPLRQQLCVHPLYSRLRTLVDVRLFQQHHVFAVWDFMSLLKALQRALTSLDLVWRPRGDEESDDDQGGYTSHYELYRRAMREAGTDGAAIDAVLAQVEAGVDVFAALQAAPAPARRFCTTTFELVHGGSLPAIAAAFTLGREDVIPDMFTALVDDLHQRHPGGLPTLVDYLRRHIELDGERHGPMAARLLAHVCGEDSAKWAAAVDGAERAIRARLRLWDELLALLPADAASSAAAGVGAS
jgi:pyrroloquinoline quinone (PQQ) biosynthesis protein C